MTPKSIECLEYFFINLTAGEIVAQESLLPNNPGVTASIWF